MLTKSFNNCQIRVREEDQYISLTDMAKATGKRVNNWTRLPSTQEFLSEYVLIARISAEHLIHTSEQKHGKESGTWAHPDIAIQFAQWCNPRFAAQVSFWVRELLSTGKVELKNSIDEETGELKDLRQQYEDLKGRLRQEQAYYDLASIHRSYLADVIAVLADPRNTKVKKFVKQVIAAHPYDFVQHLMQEWNMKQFYELHPTDGYRWGDIEARINDHFEADVKIIYGY